MLQRTIFSRFPAISLRAFSIEKPDVNRIKHDFIGPPDPKSHLRPILRHIPKDESPLHRNLRLKQIEVEEWNQKFWENHNARFYKEREEFIKANKCGDEALTADNMSVFYKAFLDKNWRQHVEYNLAWYSKNLELLVLAARVRLEELFKRKKNLEKN